MLNTAQGREGQHPSRPSRRRQPLSRTADQPGRLRPKADERWPKHRATFGLRRASAPLRPLPHVSHPRSPHAGPCLARRRGHEPSASISRGTLMQLKTALVTAVALASFGLGATPAMASRRRLSPARRTRAPPWQRRIRCTCTSSSRRATARRISRSSTPPARPASRSCSSPATPVTARSGRSSTCHRRRRTCSHRTGRSRTG